MKKRVVVFAGNECLPSKEEYYFSLAFNTGKLLAENGYIVVTGGGPGLMNEVCKGAIQAGGKTVGVCLDIPGRLQSSFLTKRVDVPVLSKRQKKLLNLGDAYIALPGGIGTFSEIFEVIALKRKDEIARKTPLILIDEIYFASFQNLILHLIKEGFTNKSIYLYYSIVKTPKQAITILNKYEI